MRSNEEFTGSGVPSFPPATFPPGMRVQRVLLWASARSSRPAPPTSGSHSVPLRGWTINQWRLPRRSTFSVGPCWWRPTKREHETTGVGAGRTSDRLRRAPLRDGLFGAASSCEGDATSRCEGKIPSKRLRTRFRSTTGRRASASWCATSAAVRSWAMSITAHSASAVGGTCRSDCDRARSRSCSRPAARREDG